MLNRRKARMTEWSGGLGHLVTSADWLARITHDPQHVCERQLAGCGCFLPHLLVCATGRSLTTASARPLSTVSVHRAIAVDQKSQAMRSESGSTCTTIRCSAQHATLTARARYRFLNLEGST